jgi:tRNA(Ile)-lysidine synthase TilS/MesJ
MAALILLLDQFPRHIHRGDRKSIEATDRRALEQCEELVKRGWHRRLTLPELVFALMPLRHSPTPERLRTVLSALDERAAVCAAETALLEKFRGATQTRLLHLEGAAGPAAANDADILEFHEFQPDAAEIAALPQQPLVRTMLSYLAERFDPEGCGHDTVAVSLSGGVDSMVIAQLLVHIRDGLARAPAGPRPPRRNDARARPEEHRPPSSGAATPAFTVAAVHVDYGNRAESAAEAAFVARWCRARGIVLRTRRITEMRRSEARPSCETGETGGAPASAASADAASTDTASPPQKRARLSADDPAGARSGARNRRDEYEKLTRDIRFGEYKALMADRTGCPAIMFGHHRGDVQENVISNAMKGGSVLDLAGMGASSTVNGVEIWRPLLAHPKSDILKFAHAYGVPYFKDSTPRWSTRGKLRGRLVPLLKEMYGEGVLRNLSALAAESAQLDRSVRSTIFAPFVRGVRRSGTVRAVPARAARAAGGAADASALQGRSVRLVRLEQAPPTAESVQGPCCVWADCGPGLHQPVFFWKRVLREMCHGSGFSTCKSRPIAQLLTWLRPPEARGRGARGRANEARRKTSARPFPRDGYPSLKGKTLCLLQGGVLHIFHPAISPLDGSGRLHSGRRRRGGGGGSPVRPPPSGTGEPRVRVERWARGPSSLPLDADAALGEAVPLVPMAADGGSRAADGRGDPCAVLRVGPWAVELRLARIEPGSAAPGSSTGTPPQQPVSVEQLRTGQFAYTLRVDASCRAPSVRVRPGSAHVSNRDRKRQRRNAPAAGRDPGGACGSAAALHPVLGLPKKVRSYVPLVEAEPGPDVADDGAAADDGAVGGWTVHVITTFCAPVSA